VTRWTRRVAQDMLAILIVQCAGARSAPGHTGNSRPVSLGSTLRPIFIHSAVKPGGMRKKRVNEHGSAEAATLAPMGREA